MQRAARCRSFGQLLGSPVVSGVPERSASSLRRSTWMREPVRAVRSWSTARRGQQLLKGFTPALISSTSRRRRAARSARTQLPPQRHAWSECGRPQRDTRDCNPRRQSSRGGALVDRRRDGHRALAGDLRQEWISRPVVRIHLCLRQPRGQHPGASAAAIGGAANQHLAHPLIGGGTQRLGMVVSPQAGWSVAGADCAATERAIRTPCSWSTATG